MNLNDIEKEYLINLIQNNESLPEDYKYILFPTAQEEYELTYAGKMRKEDILAGEDGTLPVPLQIERKFNGNQHEKFNDDWQNMIVFGDNLQFLKTINENKDPLIKDKIKGKVKLIYIDPPFATQDEFQNKDGAKAYNDKKKGSEFLEFMRRRLILAREILADDGSIYVHMDQKMGHYVKILLDEVFGKNNFQNEIVWHYRTGNLTYSRFQQKHDSIFFYGKNRKPQFEQQYLKEYYVEIYGPQKKISMKGPNDGTDEYGDFKISQMDDVWNISAVFTLSKEHISYPTQKPEELIARIIKASSNEGDIVLDFFGGSGTTMAVAEKLGRRWISCDFGKLSYLTMQKRILQIQDSKSLEYEGQLYGKKAKAFATYKLGMYDLKQTLSLEWDRYKHFVAQLFEYDSDPIKISGIAFDGERRGFPVKVFDYVKHKESAVDRNYILNLHSTLKNKGFSRVYIVAPATKVDFIADYEEVDDTRYYFLKVPYEMIEELHKTPFTKLRQPRSKSDINDIEEMKGFQFIFTPEVECKLIKDKNQIILEVSKFKSDPLNGSESDNFSTLSSIYVNYDYNGEAFLLDDVRFWNQIESKKKDDKDTKIIYKNKKEDEIKSITWNLPIDKLGEEIVFIFTDIYGNDVTVSLSEE